MRNEKKVGFILGETNFFDDCLMISEDRRKSSNDFRLFLNDFLPIHNVTTSSPVLSL